ncbi:uncharacterized protein METZ01_LOCUS109708 [marine metagenome]|uniref:Uncharacterized protein n=1 Tax=marine metagenome TaxID=408172 RepID=A0A381WWH4_9ZZZZ
MNLYVVGIIDTHRTRIELYLGVGIFS